MMSLKMLFENCHSSKTIITNNRIATILFPIIPYRNEICETVIMKKSQEMNNLAIDKKNKLSVDHRNIYQNEKDNIYSGGIVRIGMEQAN